MKVKERPYSFHSELEPAQQGGNTQQPHIWFCNSPQVLEEPGHRLEPLVYVRIPVPERRHLVFRLVLPTSQLHR